MSALRMLGDVDRRGRYKRPTLRLGEAIALMVDELCGLDDCPEFRETKVYMPKRSEDYVESSSS